MTPTDRLRTALVQRVKQTAVHQFIRFNVVRSRPLPHCTEQSNIPASSTLAMGITCVV